MKESQTLSFFLVILFLTSFAAGCVEGPGHTGYQETLKNKTEVAISIALNNSTGAVIP